MTNNSIYQSELSWKTETTIAISLREMNSTQGMQDLNLLERLREKKSRKPPLSFQEMRKFKELVLMTSAISSTQVMQENTQKHQEKSCLYYLP
jgi:hypothetical protein